MKKGINIWSFPEGRPILECAKLAKKEGFDGIELSLNESGELGLETTEQETMALRQNIADFGLEISGSAMKVNPNGASGFTAELSSDNGYYNELVYFLNAVQNEQRIEVCTPESTAETLAVVRQRENLQLRKVPGLRLNNIRLTL